MITSGGMGPREDFSSFWNKNVIRNEHLRRDGAKVFLLSFFKELTTWGGGAREDFSFLMIYECSKK